MCSVQHDELLTLREIFGTLWWAIGIGIEGVTQESEDHKHQHCE
jgi:hypothetical protein